MIGAYPCVSLVRLVVIGYHCNCLGGQRNYYTPANQWVYYVSIMQSVICGMHTPPTGLGWQVVGNKALDGSTRAKKCTIYMYIYKLTIITIQ